jgi:cyanophycinase
MQRRLFSLAVLLLFVSGSPPAPAQESWSADQRQVLDAIAELSAATAPGGGGADAYGVLLADRFSRWTVGSETTSGKLEWVEGIRDWFDGGWRVADRESDTVEIVIRGEYAFTRRIVRETYAGPDGESSSSSAALSEVWIRSGASWRLLRVNVDPMASPAATEYGPARGSLVIAGGGPLDGTGIIERFIELGGGAEDGRFVIIPTAAGNLDGDSNVRTFDPERVLGSWRARGLANVTMLHTHDPAVADSEEFAAPLRDATGVWFPGGRQWNIVDSYAGTRTYDELHAVLSRGGVIGGSSAGATIQGEYLVRGDTSGSGVVMTDEEDHQLGFEFLRRTAIDQHLDTRDRWDDIIPVIEQQPHLLGIGLSESTAIVVSGDTFEVIGEYMVAIHDNTRPRQPWDKPFFVLAPGDRYDMKARRSVPVVDPETVTVEYVAHGSFRLASPAGGRILIDPFTSRWWLGYDFPADIDTDAVLTSHPHPDHDGGLSRDQAPWPESTPVLRDPGRRQLAGFDILGVEGKHADPYGKEFGQTNTIWVIEAAGMRIAHLGDNGPLSAEAVAAIGEVDILMIPIDSEFHILAQDEIDAILEQLSPRVVVPMHYRHADLEVEEDSPSDLGGINAWLEGRPNVRRLPSNTATISADMLPSGGPVILVFEHWPQMEPPR